MQGQALSPDLSSSGAAVVTCAAFIVVRGRNHHIFQQKKTQRQKEDNLHFTNAGVEEKLESTFPVALKKKTTPAFGLPYERRGTKDGMLSLSHTPSPTLLLRHKNRALLFLPPLLLLLLLPSFQNTSKWSRIKRDTPRSNFCVLEQFKYKTRTVATTEQVDPEKKWYLFFQNACDKGSQSRKEASLSELFRQRSKSVDSRRRISFRNLATTEIGPDKKHLLQNSCDSGATRSRKEASSLSKILRQRKSVQRRR